MLRQSHPHVTRSLLYASARMFTVTVPFSTRHRLLELDKSQSVELDKSQSVEPQTPRYLPRQSLQKEKAREEGGIALFRQNDIPRYRSKYLSPDPSTRRKTNKEGLKLLEPHVLSQRIKKLCDRGKLDDAVSLLQNSPLAAQNTPVWNTLIWETIKVQRYKLAYTLYIDMKRRGHSPTTRTYQTMLNGLARIEDFSAYSQQLKNATLLYDSFKRHLKSIQQINPTDSELSVNPIASYIKILGNSKRYDEAYEALHSLDSEGPLSANHLVYTSMFQVLASRPTVGTPISRRGDIRALWAQVVKASKKNPNFIIDTQLATAAIFALIRGQTVDHDFGFQIVRDFFGLCPPGTQPVTGSLALSSKALSAVLRLCNASSNFDLCVDFFTEVKRRPVKIGGVDILDRLHVEEVLRAHQALNVATSGYQSLQILEWVLRQGGKGKINLQMSTFHLILTTCWHSADWGAAMRTFDLMTGYRSHDFMDGAVKEQPRLDRSRRGCSPTAETMSSLVRIAYATRNYANMRQCLRMVDHLGPDTLLSQTSEDAESRTAAKNQRFYATKLAQGLVEMIEYVLAETRSQKSPADLERWKTLLERAKMELRLSGEAALVPTLQRKMSVDVSPGESIQIGKRELD